MNITVTQILRPIKLAFLITPNNKRSLQRAVRICSSIWGGKHFPILCFHAKFSEKFRHYNGLLYESVSEYYSNAFANFKVDYLVTDRDIDHNFLTEISKNIPIVSIDEIEKSVGEKNCKYGISIDEVYDHFIEKEFKFVRRDSTQICIPDIHQDLFLEMIFGNINTEIVERLNLDINQRPRINRENFFSYLSDDKINCLHLSLYKTEILSHPLWSSSFAVFILDTNNINDLVNFWNLRALGWNIVAVPSEEIENPAYHDLVLDLQEKLYKANRWKNEILVLFNQDIEAELGNRQYDILKKLQLDKSNPISFVLHHSPPRFWLEVQNLHWDKTIAISVRSANRKTVLSLDSSTISLPLLIPEIINHSVRHNSPRYINQIEVEFEDLMAFYAQIFPNLSSRELDFIIRGSGYGQWFFPNSTISFHAKYNDESLSFALPNAFEVFEKWFANKGLEIRMSAPGKLGQELLKNVGGVNGLSFLANEDVLAVLSFFENGKVVLKKTLDIEINKRKNRSQELNKDQLRMQLLQKKIIEFGAQLKCFFCNQHSFFHLNDLNTVLKCPVCHNKFGIPAHSPEYIKWAYRGIGPFSKNNKAEGLLSVLLTLRFFRISLRAKHLTLQMSFEMLKNKKVINEIDLGLFFSKYTSMYSPVDFFICECKTEIEFQEKDVQKMIALARAFPGAILTFATLKKVLSQSEKRRIALLANLFRRGLGPRPVNPILVLTGNELLPNDHYQPLSNIQDIYEARFAAADEIGHLCDVTCRKYLDLPPFSEHIEAKLAKIFDRAERRKQS